MNLALAVDELVVRPYGRLQGTGCGPRKQKLVARPLQARCPTCGEKKPTTLEHWYSHANETWGVALNKCIACRRARKRWLRHTPKAKRNQEVKALRAQGRMRCRMCHVVKPNTSEHFARMSPTKLETRCRPCRCAARRAEAQTPKGKAKSKRMWIKQQEKYKREGIPESVRDAQRASWRRAYEDAHRLIRGEPLKYPGRRLSHTLAKRLLERRIPSARGAVRESTTHVDRDIECHEFIWYFTIGNPGATATDWARRFGYRPDDASLLVKRRIAWLKERGVEASIYTIAPDPSLRVRVESLNH
jgi:hypothetical protein